MKYAEYKKMSNDEKELHNFELNKRMMSTLQETCKNAKETNGNVRDVNLWRSKANGMALIINVVIWPLFFWLITRTL